MASMRREVGVLSAVLTVVAVAGILAYSFRRQVSTATSSLDEVHQGVVRTVEPVEVSLQNGNTLYLGGDCPVRDDMDQLLTAVKAVPNQAATAINECIAAGGLPSIGFSAAAGASDLPSTPVVTVGCSAQVAGFPNRFVEGETGTLEKLSYMDEDPTPEPTASLERLCTLRPVEAPSEVNE